jgi:hypothetical protein
LVCAAAVPAMASASPVIAAPTCSSIVRRFMSSSS